MRKRTHLGFGRNRLLATSLAVLAAASTVAACSSSGGGSNGNNSGGAGGNKLEKTRLTIGYGLPDIGTSAPFWIAKDKGWYKDAGLSVNLIKVGEPMNGVIGGSLDVAVEDPEPVVQGHSRGAGVLMVCGWRYQQPLIIVTAKGVASPPDLKGKSVALGLSATDPAVNHRVSVLKDHGWDIRAQDVKFVSPPGSTDAYTKLLEAGRIGLTYAFPRQIKGVEASGGKVLFNIMDQVISDVLIAKKSWITSNPNTIEAFLKATIKAKDYLKNPANEDEIAKIMQDAGFSVTAQEKANWAAEYNTHTADCSIPDKNFETAMEAGGLTNPGLSSVSDLSFAEAADKALGVKFGDPAAAPDGGPRSPGDGPSSGG